MEALIREKVTEFNVNYSEALNAVECVTPGKIDITGLKKISLNLSNADLNRAFN